MCCRAHRQLGKLVNVHTVTDIFLVWYQVCVWGEGTQTHHPEVESHALLTGLALCQKWPSLVDSHSAITDGWPSRLPSNFSCILVISLFSSSSKPQFPHVQGRDSDGYLIGCVAVRNPTCTAAQNACQLGVVTVKPIMVIKGLGQMKSLTDPSVSLST
jgi:hypothetical protein